MKLKLHATPAEVMRAVAALEAFATEHGVPPKSVFSLTLALEECGANIVNHALQRDNEKTFHVSFACEADTFVIELRDAGPAFDPTAAASRKAQADDDDLPGGWGIQLVRRQIDEIGYTREAGENILRLTKKLNAAAD